MRIKQTTLAMLEALKELGDDGRGVVVVHPRNKTQSRCNTGMILGARRARNYGADAGGRSP